MAVEWRKLSDGMGAEIQGVDLSKKLSDSVLADIQDAFVEHKILVFRRQDLAPDQQIAFTEHFGPIKELDDKEHRLKGYPKILILSNEVVNGKHIGVVAAGDFWHSDLSYLRKPGLATLLYAKKLPTVGGETEFADMHGAYDSLAADLKERIRGLRGVHTANKLRNPRVAVTRPGGAEYYQSRAHVADVAHPMVRIHPVSGRKGLYVSPRFTIAVEGMDDSEAQPLLDTLFAHQVKAAHVYRHKYQPGDVVMWDNRSLNHRACGGYAMDDIRLLHRTSTGGDEPFGD